MEENLESEGMSNPYFEMSILVESAISDIYDAQGWAEEIKDENEKNKYLIKFGVILEALKTMSNELDDKKYD